jgi:hypothetical protein
LKKIPKKNKKRKKFLMIWSVVHFVIALGHFGAFVMPLRPHKTSDQSPLNPHLLCCVLKDRDQKYFGEVSLWPAEYRNRPPKVPLIFNFKNFGEFQKLLIRPEMHDLDAIFCFMQLKQQWNQIIIYKYTYNGYFRR